MDTMNKIEITFLVNKLTILLTHFGKLVPQINIIKKQVYIYKFCSAKISNIVTQFQFTLRTKRKKAKMY